MADHWCPELVESCYRFSNTLSKLSVHHSICVITWVCYGTTQKLASIQYGRSQNLRRLIGVESDPLR